MAPVPVLDPVALARVRRIIVAVAVAMAIWSVLGAFFGIWPGDAVATSLAGYGVNSLRAVLVGTFVVIGLGVLAVLLPLVLVVNAWRNVRGTEPPIGRG